MADDFDPIAAYGYELGYLKRLPRAGWHVAGVPQPEAVASHSHRATVLGILLAHLEGADPGRVAIMCALHDTQETRIGDVPGVGKRYVQTAGNVDVTADQTGGFPPAIRAAFLAAVTEYEDRVTVEAACARDADKLECLLQAREYEAAGNAAVGPWIESSLRALRTPSGRRLGARAVEVDPGAWWAQAAAEYPQRPRAAVG